MKKKQQTLIKNNENRRKNFFNNYQAQKEIEVYFKKMDFNFGKKE